MNSHSQNTGFQFDSRQQYQLDAINAVVDLFDGQPKDADKIAIALRGSVASREGELDLGIEQEIGAIGNHLVLDEGTILANLQTVQDRNGLEVSEKLVDDKLDFDIEMETGTGKTYVYLRTVFELAKKYGFTKFIVLVPSVAIREGVNTSIRLMREHFRSLYPAQPFDANIYSGDKAEEVQAFATATNVQILVMTIDAIRGNKNTRIIHQQRDKLNGLRPLDYLKGTHPVVIMDEPQNMESLLSQSAVGELYPVFTLRYSATHKQRRNLVYRLDPVDAHDLGLVKQIVVAEVAQHGADVAPYVKLLEVKDTKAAKLELACRKADGSIARRSKKVKPHQELSDVTGNPAYAGWRINALSIAAFGESASIELTPNGSLLYEGESLGGATGTIYKEMIRETVREHLRKESMLRPKGIKVLSLFFVDKVASFLGDGVNNEDANGEFTKWFDEVFREERSKSDVYQTLLPQDPCELRRAYFSQLKTRGGTTFVDSSGTTAKDDDAYKLIMQDKQRLLDGDEPVRFIFSHSALREGWDNPNVFQICTLREMGAETERRQTLGRGLRLPVAKTVKGYERVADRSIALLTVVANESYATFAQNLQAEYKEAGVAIGQVRPNEFAKLMKRDIHGVMTEDMLGFKTSSAIFKHLENAGFIKDGKTTSMFLPDAEGFSLHLPDELRPYESDIIRCILNAGIEKYVKPASARAKRKFNKELYASPDFERLWSAISQKTTYRVTVKHPRLVEACIKAIKSEPKIQPLRIDVTRAGVKVLRGGTQGQELGARTVDLKGSYDLPDIIGELQQGTSLTRKTLVDILIGSGRLDEFIANPNDFIAMIRRCVEGELQRVIVEGVQYEKIGGSVYELRELQADGLAEKDFFKEHLYRVEHPEKTDFDYVVFDGGPDSPERKFAEFLDHREDIRLFMKLPPRFQIDTPVGPYNPDWAIIKSEEGGDRIYMVRETKSTMDEQKRRPSENAKIKSAEAHFREIGIEYAVSVPEQWNI
ncbi:DEAD/DEAH box helicase family protein [Pectobacterium brasiliense]|uniref:restriction endonuclease n=1 Tax=Pectobacterium TaxID=122277 RepID=UPI00057D875C|nr:DEAD/DEAH box helicase family protein [Pectobacterium brasiliense]KHS70388.1 restriction endonuclease [Pectobacterium brasiliense]KHS78654.1 restriction endonuclease [Pectobacterium brasiliense]KHS97023.1 restriction endonuclease [Pectobacterium brasiliense]KHT06906.1 restriction endonuclease [Pectobacterium brasiliense]KHT12285.1 restriction endonuclease [Pectobacterium brasiliense]